MTTFSNGEQRNSIRTKINASITTTDAMDQGVATTDSPTFAGLTTTGNVSFGDNDKAIFGAGSDLQIYHSGSHSYITDTGTGSLYIRGSDFVSIQAADGTNSIVADTDSEVTLYHNGSPKLATTSTGIDVTGTVDGRDVAADGTKLDGIESGADVTDATNVAAAGALMSSSNLSDLADAATARTNLGLGTAATTASTDYATAAQGTLADSAVQPNDSPTFAGLTTTGNATFGDNDRAIFGAGSDLQIYHDGLNSYIQENGIGNLRIRATDLSLEKNAGGEYYLQATADGAVRLYYDASQKLATTSTGIDVTGTVTADGLTVSGQIVANGGVYLGGTGAANKLDDYEEGTWTPTLNTVWSGPSNPLNSASGAYTKIGNLVTCVANLDFAESGTNIAVDHRFAIESLPFLPDMSNITGSGTVWVYDGMSAGNNSMGFVGTGNTSVAYIYISHTDGTTNYADIIRLSFSYFTTA